MKTDTQQQTKHTLGPWRASDGALATDHTPDHFEVMAGQHGEKLIAHVFYGQSMGEMEVNARLIAAAPDLLAALRNVGNVLAALATGQIKTVDRDSPALAQIRAAIAKAEGRA